MWILEAAGNGKDEGLIIGDNQELAGDIHLIGIKIQQKEVDFCSFAFNSLIIFDRNAELLVLERPRVLLDAS